MSRDKNPALWEAMESALRSVAHIARSSDLEGQDRVERLQDAVREVEGARRLLEDALVEAEVAASDGPEFGGPDDDGEEGQP